MVFNRSLHVVRWEDEVAQKPSGMSLNQFFAEKATECHITVVLLIDKIRPGTLAELKSVLDAPNAQLAVLWFPRKTFHGNVTLKKFLDKNKNRVLYNRLDAPNTDATWLGLARVLVRVAIEGFRFKHAEPLVEVR